MRYFEKMQERRNLEDSTWTFDRAYTKREAAEAQAKDLRKAGWKVKVVPDEKEKLYYLFFK